MSGAATIGSARPARQQQPLDFERERDLATTSWDRADPVGASIERLGRYGFIVTLPGGDEHVLAVGCRPDGQHVGWCRCRGFEYNDGPCAHLCTVRKADWHTRTLGTNLLDEEGRPIEIATTVEHHDQDPSEHTSDLSQLTDRQREVYLAVVDRGLQPKDVAHRDDLAPTTARTHLYRARQKLAQQTGEVFDGGNHAR